VLYCSLLWCASGCGNRTFRISAGGCDLLRQLQRVDESEKLCLCVKSPVKLCAEQTSYARLGTIGHGEGGEGGDELDVARVLDYTTSPPPKFASTCSVRLVDSYEDVIPSSRQISMTGASLTYDTMNGARRPPKRIHHRGGQEVTWRGILAVD